MSKESMTPDPIELTRRTLVAVNEGDFDAVMSVLGPDSVFDAASWGFGTYQGKMAIRRFLEDWIGSFDEYERVAQEILDLGNGVIYVSAVTHGTPSGSREQIRLRGASAFVWTAGVIALVANYRDIDEGRTAAERLAQERE